MDLLDRIRPYVVPTVAIAFLAGIIFARDNSIAAWSLIVSGPLLAVAAFDRYQQGHSILRNFPLLGHLRFLLEGAGPELHQYFVESNTDGRPFNRDDRSLIYERAKSIEGVKPFGTELDVYREGYGFLAHSLAPRTVPDDPASTLRVTVGGPDCSAPYSSSILNISAMSFGALSGNAVRALNQGARLGGFAHNTGEGGFSRHHREPGGDIIWQIGTGYFGCRDANGNFDAAAFRDQVADPQIKMVELKLSQGAKPAHGGILPAAKVTREIADARGVPINVDCASPASHSAFGTPIELCDLIGRLREDSGGKPIGIKLCVGDPREFLAIVKAMIETGIFPDFVTVDGGEGGTGAAPQEYSDHLGMPLRDALVLVRNTIVGAALDDRVRIAASGKMSASYPIACAMALGADWCNVARGFMFSLGCIQSQTCHTNRCPVGVATQDPTLQRALVVDEKARRVHQFHLNTVTALAEMTGACGLSHPSEFSPEHVHERINPHQFESLARLYSFVERGELLDSRSTAPLSGMWNASRADRF